MLIHIVSGHMRTGTSAMMGALIAGGMDAHFDEERRAKLLERWMDDEYRGNPAFYEPSDADFADPEFPRAHQGKLLKILWGGLPRIAPTEGGYRVVFMWRDPEEIRQSHEAFFAGKKAPKWLTDGGYETRMNVALDHMRVRRDVRSVTELHYRDDLLADPVMTFARLKADGWPIDVDAAAAHIDTSLCRFRRESLEVGI